MPVTFPRICGALVAIFVAAACPRETKSTSVFSIDEGVSTYIHYCGNATTSPDCETFSAETYM